MCELFCWHEQRAGAYMFYHYLILVFILISLVLYYIYIPRFFKFEFNSRFSFAFIIGNVPVYISIVSGLLSSEEPKIRYSSIVLMLFIAVFYIIINKYDNAENGEEE